MTVHPASAPRSDDAGTAAARALGAVEVALGVVTVARARRTADASWWILGRTAMVAVVTVLGVRQVVQGTITLARPGAPVLLVGAGVDAVHAATMLPVVVAGGPYRGPSLRSGALALASATAALVIRGGLL